VGFNFKRKQKYMPSKVLVQAEETVSPIYFILVIKLLLNEKSFNSQKENY
jgi:hypothetical protein